MQVKKNEFFNFLLKQKIEFKFVLFSIGQTLLQQKGINGSSNMLKYVQDAAFNDRVYFSTEDI